MHRLDKLGRVPTNFAVFSLKPASIRPTQRSRRLNIAVTGAEHSLTNTHLLASCFAPWRDVGGKQERDLAAQYRGWSRQEAIEWPFTSRLLERIAQSYDSDAEWHDTDADLRKRLPY